MDRSVAFLKADAGASEFIGSGTLVLQSLTVRASGKLEVKFSLPAYGEATVMFEGETPSNYSLRD